MYLNNANTIINDLDGFNEIEAQKGIPGNVAMINMNNHIEKYTVLNCDLRDLVGNISFQDVDLDEELIDTDEKFFQYQYLIISGYYICLHIDAPYLRVVTENKRAFLINTDTVSKKSYSILLKVQYPYKLCINSRAIYSLSLHDINNTYDLGHSVRIMYGRENDLDLREMVELFTGASCPDLNKLMYNLFNIKNRLQTVIERHRLLRTINNDFKVLGIVRRCECAGLPFDEGKYKSFIARFENRYKAAKANIEEKLGGSFNNKIELIRLLKDNEMYPSLNIEYLKESKEKVGLLGIAIGMELKKRYENALLENTPDRLFLRYNAYDLFGQIRPSFVIDNAYIVSNQNIAVGSYKDLYFRVFANYSKNEFLINSMNSGFFFDCLSERLFGTSNPALKFCISAVLKGWLQGYWEHKDLLDYILIELDTLLYPDELEEIQSIIEEKFPELIEYIQGFDRIISREKRISFADVPNLHKFIMLTMADIHKKAITLVAGDVQDYNIKNKSKINIVGLFDNKILLEAEEEALNTAVDILNRNLIKSFEYYIKRVQAVCDVNAGRKLKS